jgi:hypothetical protein
VRLTISIDSVPHQIDSTDPVLLGNWMVEIFARAGEMNNATHIQVQVFPSFVPDPNAPQGMRPDWIADTRIVGRIFQISSPRELVEALGKQLDEAEGLAHG